MKTSEKAYRIIAISSLLILVAVQFKLIYNTFELKNNQYYLKEKKTLNEGYSLLIRNDKVFPGAQAIIDRHIYGLMDELKYTYYNQANARLAELKDKISSGILEELKSRKDMDKFFATLVTSNNLNPNLRYAITISQISYTFDGLSYIPIFDAKAKNPSAIYGEIVAGSLRDFDKQNLVSAYIVNSPLKDSYQISFSMYVDHNNRTLQILEDMLPTFLLAVGSILFVIGIYYKTYKNWMEQKKLTAMTSDFLNSISHEFNTPVATILVANHSLLKDEIIKDERKVKELSAVIDRQAQRLKKLIKQSLTITKLSDVNLDKTAVEFVPLLLESLADYSLKLDHTVQLDPEITDAHGEVLLNKFLFTTMLYNLLDNAIKYNSSKAKQVVVRLRMEENQLILSIIDNGVGIAPETLAYIYNRFYRGKHSIQADGLGLGLYYVQQVVKLHQWDLLVQSEVGKGSTFEIKMKTVE